MRALLEEREYQFDLAPVECVGYDQDLYQALVDEGAAKVTQTQNGHVSIDPQELGFSPGLV